jgi:hypothetical protein
LVVVALVVDDKGGNAFAAVVGESIAVVGSVEVGDLLVVAVAAAALDVEPVDVGGIRAVVAKRKLDSGVGVACSLDVDDVRASEACVVGGRNGALV